MAERTDSEHLTTRAIDLIIAGAGDARSTEHALRCASCEGKLSAARDAAAAFLAMNPPAVRAAQLVAEAARKQPTPTPTRSKTPTWLRWAMPAVFASAAAAFAIVALPKPPPGQLPLPITQPEILDKGAASVSLTRQLPGGAVRPAQSGDRFATGEAVQLHVTVTSPTRVRVFALEPNGVFTPVLDQSIERSGPVGASFVLDADPVPTRLLVVMDGFAQEIVLQKSAD